MEVYFVHSHEPSFLFFSLRRAFKLGGDQKVRLPLWEKLTSALCVNTPAWPACGPQWRWSNLKPPLNCCSHLAWTVCCVTLRLNDSDSPASSVRLEQSPCPRHRRLVKRAARWLDCCVYCFEEMLVVLLFLPCTIPNSAVGAGLTVNTSWELLSLLITVWTALWYWSYSPFF